jgi:outer membrane biosynthesis protein TonB
MKFGSGGMNRIMNIRECRLFGFGLVLIVVIVGCNTTPTQSPIAYDQNLKTAIEKKWDNLLDKTKIPSRKKSGETVVTFKLYPDGNVDSFKVITNTAPVSELIAVQAIKDCAPFPQWSDDMRRMIITNNKDYRECTFTFNY